MTNDSLIKVKSIAECSPAIIDLENQFLVFLRVALDKFYCTKNYKYNSFLANGHFYHLLIAFTNSLDPDQDWECQDWQNVSPDLDPNSLTLWKCSRKDFWKKLILKKKPDENKSVKKSQHAKIYVTKYRGHNYRGLIWARSKPPDKRA